MKSKAKRLDNGKWIDGYYFRFNDRHYISTGTEMIEIDKKTVCQKVRGTSYFEGDEVTDGEGVGFIEWDIDDCKYVVLETPYRHNINSVDEWKITGKNIHD